MTAENLTDFELKPYSANDEPKIIQLFVVAKLTNGSCHLVHTEPEIDTEIFDFLEANAHKGKIEVYESELPVDFIHFDGRKI